VRATNRLQRPKQFGMENRFGIRHREVDERTCVVALQGDLDLASAPELKWTLVELFDKGYRQYVIDLSELTHMDSMGLEDGAALGDVIERHSHVACVIAGHLHRPIATRWHGTIAMTAPSVAHQVMLDLRPDRLARFVFEPPAILLHRWSAAGGMVSHVSYVGDYEGPYWFDGQPA